MDSSTQVRSKAQKRRERRRKVASSHAGANGIASGNVVQDNPLPPNNAQVPTYRVPDQTLNLLPAGFIHDGTVQHLDGLCLYGRCAVCKDAKNDFQDAVFSVDEYTRHVEDGHIMRRVEYQFGPYQNPVFDGEVFEGPTVLNADAAEFVPGKAWTGNLHGF